MRALLIAIGLSSVGGNLCAQPGNGRGTAFDLCFQLAGAAGAICDDPRNSAAGRWDWQKTRARLDECFAHAARSAPSETPAGAGSSELPSRTMAPESPPSAVSPNKSDGIGPPSSTYGVVQSKKPSATVLPDKPTETLDKPTGTVAPELPGGGLANTRSANESMTGLDSCFQAAHIADAICSKLPHDSALRLDCSRKTRAAQLECLEGVLSETPAGPSRPP